MSDGTDDVPDDEARGAASAAANSLPRDERLHGRGCVSRFFEGGRRGSAGKVVALALPNPNGPRRMAAVAGKKLGAAPLRSRLRRRLRAAYRTQKAAFPAGWDFVLMARPGLAEAAWQDVMRWSRQAAERAVRQEPAQAPPQAARRTDPQAMRRTTATAQASTGPRPSRRRK